MAFGISRFRTCLGIVSFGVIVIVFILLWQEKSIDMFTQILGEAEKCPSLQKHQASTQNVYGFDPEVRKALRCRFEERRKRLNQSCRATGPHIYKPAINKTDTDGRTSFVKNDFTICLLQKIGSKFWNRYLDDLNGVETRSLKPKEYQDHVKIVFVRDPYSRLFSGYIDKFFTANPSYWKIVGPSIIKAVRLNSSGILPDTKCGTDITFAEFVEYILKNYNVHNMDRHFIPIQHRCDFCGTKYDFIGKMETFLDDVIFISDAVGLLKYNQTRKFLLEEGLNNGQEMKRDVQYIYNHFLEELKYCGVSPYQALKLTWRHWQIQGFIETKFDFPFKRGDTIDPKRLSKLALDAQRSSDRQKLSAAKKAALQQAYSTLSLKTKLKLKEIFLSQFDMFDYEAMPENVFGNYSFDFLEKQTIFTGLPQMNLTS